MGRGALICRRPAGLIIGPPEIRGSVSGAPWRCSWPAALPDRPAPAILARPPRQIEAPVIHYHLHLRLHAAPAAQPIAIEGEQVIAVLAVVAAAALIIGHHGGHGHANCRHARARGHRRGPCLYLGTRPPG
jgi:hypothetical protein